MSRTNWTPRTETEMLTAAFRTNLTLIEVEMQTKYPDKPDFQSINAALTNLSNYLAALVVECAKQKSNG